MEIAVLIVVVVAVFVLIMLMSSCFRGLRRAHQLQHTTELARRRQAYCNRIAASQTNRPGVGGDSRVVRVATIAGGGNGSVSYEIYEIQLPRNGRQPPVVFQQHVSDSPDRPRQGRRTRPSRPPPPPEVLTPPPPFSTALEQSVPVDNMLSHSISIEEPPPSYDDYLRLHSSGENLVPAESKERF